MNSLTLKEIAEESTITVGEMEPAGEEQVEWMRSIALNMDSTENSTPQEHSISSCSLQYLFEENRDEYLEFGVPLYEASIIGDWETAKLILETRPELVRFGLSKQLGTALHVAVSAEQNKMIIHFVMNLVNMMTTEELELQNEFGNTAFFCASMCGNTKLAMIMVEKNPNLEYIRSFYQFLPLTVSALKGNYDTLRYLYVKSQKMTGDHWTHYDRQLVVENCMERKFFDIALQIMYDRPELAATVSLLEILARMPDSFVAVEDNAISRIINSVCRFFGMRMQPAAEDTDALKLLKIIWRNAIRTMDLEEIKDMLKEPTPGILFVAAEMGNTSFIAELFRTYPDLMFDINEDGHTVFHIAVMHRHQGIYNLMHEIGSVNNDICIRRDCNGNNLLHLVGKSSKEMTAKMAGASLLMQRELLWFKEIEKIMPSYMTNMKNKDDQTPYELFSKESEDLVSKGLKWMKDCMVVATLIVTVAFAIAFTVPGGYKQETGIPFFIHETSFLVFVIADAVSLFFSTTSLLVFLCILTSRQGQRDFMYSLPRKLMIGLLSLFISVAAMMVTFSSSFFVLYHKRLKWVPLLIAALSTIPVITFAVLQFPLLVDMFRSTYDSYYLFYPKKRIIYTTKPRLPRKSFIARVLLGRW